MPSRETIDPGKHARARLQPSRQSTGEYGNWRFDQERKAGKGNPEDKQRDGWMLCRRRHELRQKSEVKNCDFGIRQIGERTIQKKLAQWTYACRRNRQIATFGTQQADAKIKQVRRANQLERKK